MPSDTLIFQSTDTPSDDALAVVDAGLDRHNNDAAPLGDVRPLAVFARDGGGCVVGGGVGRTWGRCCELQQLWVATPHRTSGVGSRLVSEFEARAKTRGCSIFYLSTFSFQALEFYRRNHYVVLAEINGYPDGIVKYLMHKTEPDQGQR